MTLTIKDLSSELDHAALATVRGGNNGNAGVNTLSQQLGMNTPIGIVTGAGGAANNFIDVSGSQDATLVNEQDSGDKFAAFLLALRG